MARTVHFTIKGDAKQALASLKSVESQLDRIAQHAGFTKVTRDVKTASAALRVFQQQTRTVQKGLKGMTQEATGFRRSFGGVNKFTVQLNSSLKVTQGLTSKISAAQTVQTRQVKQTSRAYEAAVGAARRLQGVVARVNQAMIGIRASSTQIAGGLQSAAISMRMSGIALGNQLGQVLNQTLSGNVFSPLLETLRQTLTQGAGILTIGVEMGARLVTGIGGAIVKGIGPLVGGAAQVLLGSIGLLFSRGNILRPITAAFAGIGNIAQNALIGVTNIIGEIGIQAGNAFVGVAEVARGAFQAVVNVAGTVLNGLVTVAQNVVEKVGGVLGKLGKSVLGTAGILGGFAARDLFRTEKGLTGALILLDPKVTADQKKRLREWVFNMRKEFANLPASTAGDVLEMFISTGFQSRPELAQQMAQSALQLASGTGEQNGRDIARAMAKGYNLFGSEIDAAAKRLGTNPADLLADSFFALRNYSDLTMGEIANRFAEVLGIGKQFKLTFEEISQITAGVSLALGPEQTFTGVQQLFESFRKLREGGREILRREKIEFKELTASEKSRLATLREQAASLTEQVGSLDKLKQTIKTLTAEKGVASAAGDKDKVKALRTEIAALRKEAVRLEQQGAKGALSGITDEIDHILAKGGFLTNILSTLEQIDKASKEGRITPFELRDIVPNIRALRAQAARLALDSGQRAEIRQGVSFGAAQGSSGRAQGTRSEEAFFQISRIGKQLTEPFVAFYNQNRDQFLGFLKDAVSYLERFNAKWREVISAPGAGEFAKNLGGKLGLGALNLQPEGIDPTKFWDAMNAGLNKVFEIGGKVITGFKTLWSVISDVATASTTLQKVWATIGSAGGGIAAFGEDLVRGDAETFKTRVKAAFTSVKADVAGFFASIVGGIQSAFAAVSSGLSNLMSLVPNISIPSFGEAAVGLGAYAGLRGARAAAGAARAGTGAVAATAAGLATSRTPAALYNPAAAATSRAARVAAGARGVVGVGGRLLGGAARALGPVAGALTAFDLVSRPGSDVNLGSAAMNIAGGAAAGFAVGGPLGAAIGAVAAGVIDAGKALVAAIAGTASGASGWNTGNNQRTDAFLANLSSNFGSIAPGQSLNTFLRGPAYSTNSFDERFASENFRLQVLAGKKEGKFVNLKTGRLDSYENLPEDERKVVEVRQKLLETLAGDMPTALKAAEVALLKFNLQVETNALIQRRTAEAAQKRLKDALAARAAEDKAAKAKQEADKVAASVVGGFTEAVSAAAVALAALAKGKKAAGKKTASATGSGIVNGPIAFGPNHPLSGIFGAPGPSGAGQALSLLPTPTGTSLIAKPTTETDAATAAAAADKVAKQTAGAGQAPAFTGYQTRFGGLGVLGGFDMHRRAGESGTRASPFGIFTIPSKSDRTGPGGTAGQSGGSGVANEAAQRQQAATTEFRKAVDRAVLEQAKAAKTTAVALTSSASKITAAVKEHSKTTTEAVESMADKVVELETALGDMRERLAGALEAIAAGGS